MKVLLIRHAPAENPDPAWWADDSLRPLTATGKRKFARAAHGLRTLCPTPDVVLASPYLRTRQTAEILHTTAMWPEATPARELASGIDPASVIPVLEQLRTNATTLKPGSELAIALIGHEPVICELASLLLTGEKTRLAVPFRKGAVLSLSLSRVAPGTATLEWFLGPGTLRRLGG